MRRLLDSAAIGPMMLPHDGVGGFTPTPRMLSVPSATIATATPSSAIDIIAGSTLGSTSRIMMRSGLAPWARAASTNSRCDQLSDDAPRDPAEQRDRHDADREDQDQDLRVDGVAARPPGLPERALEERHEREGEDHGRDGEEHVEQRR